MNFRDSSAKMSKSSKSDFSRINLLDASDLIRKKIVKAKTDSIQEIYYDEKRPELANLIRIFGNLNEIEPSQVCEQYKWSDIAEFKDALFQSVDKELSPIREKTYELAHSNKLKEELQEGVERARSIASTNFKEIKKLIGFSDLH